jgi:hypothetical protein
MLTNLVEIVARNKPASLLDDPNVQARLDRMQDDDSRLDLVADNPQPEEDYTLAGCLKEANYQAGFASRLGEDLIRETKTRICESRADGRHSEAAALQQTLIRIQYIVEAAQIALHHISAARDLSTEQAAS